jgi:hypothetical protein
LAVLVEQLELDQPSLLTVEDLAVLADELGLGTSARVATQRLAKQGWLLPTGVRGVWEFAPASRAGAHSSAHHDLLLAAQLAATPDLPARVALSSALWTAGLADRRPDILEVSLPPRVRPPTALRDHARVVRFKPVLPPVQGPEVPTDRPETVLVHLADTPTQVHSWAAMLDGLDDLLDACEVGAVVREAAGRPHATQVRLCYLLEGRPMGTELADRLTVEPAGKVWFGPRGPLRRHHARWNVADTVLPWAPRIRGEGA